ncbi:hypothetical protein HGG70_08175, partial [Rhodobacteraceae bacterium R_SAG4]|nr:hypothetical protein [Rhodobacteraceae bacterium R_SAG4]
MATVLAHPTQTKAEIDNEREGRIRRTHHGFGAAHNIMNAEDHGPGHKGGCRIADHRRGQVHRHNREFLWCGVHLVSAPRARRQIRDMGAMQATIAKRPAPLFANGGKVAIETVLVVTRLLQALFNLGAAEHMAKGDIRAPGPQALRVLLPERGKSAALPRIHAKRRMRKGDAI